MKALELNMPDDVYEKLEHMALHDHQSVNAFALRKLEEFARASEAFKELDRRAQQSDREKFKTAMAKVASVPPMTGDEI